MNYSKLIGLFMVLTPLSMLAYVMIRQSGWKMFVTVSAATMLLTFVMVMGILLLSGHIKLDK